MNYKFVVTVEDNTIYITNGCDSCVYDGNTTKDVSFAVEDFIEGYLIK